MIGSDFQIVPICVSSLLRNTNKINRFDDFLKRKREDREVETLFYIYFQKYLEVEI